MLKTDKKVIGDFTGLTYFGDIMGRKRSRTAHEKQVRFFLILFGALFVLIAVGLIILISRPWAVQ
jgi:hypothetical protein